MQDLFPFHFELGSCSPFKKELTEKVRVCDRGRAEVEAIWPVDTKKSGNVIVGNL